MRKFWLFVLAASACTGCTAISLERYTLDQIATGGEFRIKEVLDCLATVAADPSALPSFSLIVAGTTHVQDMASLSSTTLWSRAEGSFATETLNPSASRQPQGAWTISPVVDDAKLRALRCACRWVIYGPDKACSDCPGLLDDPERALTPEPHFGVADRLAALPPGWVHMGCLKDVPSHTCYKAHHGGTWVWVTEDGAEAFAAFTLILHDIATIDPTVAQPILLVTLEVDAPTCLDPVNQAQTDQSSKDSGKPLDAAKFQKDAPKSVTADASNGLVTVRWCPVAGAQSYWVYRGGVLLKGKNGRDARTAATFYVDDTVGGKVATYEYKVRASAIDSSGSPPKTIYSQFSTTKQVTSDGRQPTQNAYSAADLLDRSFGNAWSACPPAKDLIWSCDHCTKGENSTCPKTAVAPLTFQVVRVIRPCFKCEIENRIQEGMRCGEVNITWNDWMEWTTPYHGPHTNISSQARSLKPPPPTAPPPFLFRQLPLYQSIPAPVRESAGGVISPGPGPNQLPAPVREAPGTPHSPGPAPN